MNARPACGDPVRLKRLLSNDLGAAEQAGLVSHLDTCPECQRSLEALAAARPWWDELHWLAGPAAPGANTGNSETIAAATGCGAPALDFLAPSDQPGALGRLGIYEVVAVIGRGGFAVVLKALDPTLNRTVAIKVLDPGLASSATARLRFAREARAAAAIAHEHLVAIHAVDSARGLPYIVMQYVPGQSLQDRINQSGPLELKEILRIGAQTAAGLAAAHAQGLIHRDIKPSNILLENCLERVKLTDFGLARAVDDASVTQSGVVAGTPQYMAPEQARGDALDPRTDLFSLGSVLYAMGTGHPPFRAETSMAVLHRVCEDTPRSVREFNPEIPEWFEAIIKRLHAKDPDGRFATAAEVARLLNECLAHVQDPTRFALPRVPIGKPPRFTRPARRAGVEPTRWDLEPCARKAAPQRLRPRAIAAAALVLVLGVIGAAEATGSKVSGLVATMSELISIARGGKPVIRVNLEPEDAVADGKDRAALRGHAEAVTAPALAPGGRTLSSAVLDKRVKRRVAGEPIARGRSSLKVHNKCGWFLAFSPDGKLIASGGSAIKLVDVASQRVSATLEVPTDRVNCGAFAPDGQTLATGGYNNDPVVRLWDVSSGRERLVLQDDDRFIFRVAFAPDGQTLAAAYNSGLVRLWDHASNGGLLHGHLAAYNSGLVRLWDPASGAQLGSIQVDATAFMTLAFAPDGKTLAVGTFQGEIALADVATRNVVARFPAHEDEIRSLAFARDGTLLVSAGSDRLVKVWDIPSRTGRDVLDRHQGPVQCVQFSPDGKMLATAGSDRTIRLWETATGAEMTVLRGHANDVFGIAFAPDGRTLASTGVDGTIRLWDMLEPTETVAKE